MPEVVLSADSSAQDLAYYHKIRDTIQGLDTIIVKVITDSVTMITGSLTLSVLLYDKLSGPVSKSVGGFMLTVIAALITLNSRQRIRLYSGLLGEAVSVAKAIELKIFPSDTERLTFRLDRVPRAGIKGERIYKRSTDVFFAIETLLGIFYFWSLVVALKPYISKAVALIA